MTFEALATHAFGWLLLKGFVYEQASDQKIRFARPPVAVELYHDPQTHEVSVTVYHGGDFADLLTLRSFRGDVAGINDPGPNIAQLPVANSELELQNVLRELSDQLASFNDVALDPNGDYVARLNAWSEKEWRRWRQSPRWISAMQIARIFAGAGDYEAAIKELEPYEGQLDDQSKRFLQTIREAHIKQSGPDALGPR